MESTPVTVFMVLIAVGSMSVSAGFLLWIWKQLKDLKGEIAMMVRDAEEQSEKRLGPIASELTAHSAKITFLNERVHAIELKAADDRARIAESYMSKASAGSALDKLAAAIDAMRASFDARFVAIESHLRAHE